MGEGAISRRTEILRPRGSKGFLEKSKGFLLKQYEISRELSYPSAYVDPSICYVPPVD